MIEKENIRWIQRFNNYQKAYVQLKEAVDVYQLRPLSNLEKQGLIKAFEFTQELAWNLMKDYFEYQGMQNIMGSRDAIRAAFKQGLIEDGECWMETIKSRNRSAHSYDENAANQIIEQIVDRYFSLFTDLKNKMEELKNDLAL